MKILVIIMLLLTSTVYGQTVNNRPNTFNVKMFNAKGDGTTNDAAAFQAMFDAAPSGSYVFISAGTYVVNTQVNITKPVTIFGAGKNMTSIITTSATIQMFKTTSNYTSWNYLTIANTSTGASAGCGINDSLGTNTSFNQVKIDSFYNNLIVSQSTALKITNCNFNQARNYNLWLRNDVNGDSGDQSIIGTDFYGSGVVATAAHIRWESGGGLKLSNCKFNRSGTPVPAIAIDINMVGGTADFMATNNSFENYSRNAIKIRTASIAFHNISITGNQFYSANTSTSDINILGINNIAITGNNFLSSSTDTALVLNTCDNVFLSNVYSNYVTSVFKTSVTIVTDITNNSALINGIIDNPADVIRPGADSGAITRTVNTNKFWRVAIPNYATTGSTSFAPITAKATSTDNFTDLGGNSASSVSATKIRFYTSVNNATGIGTQRMVVDSSGNLGVGIALPAFNFDVFSAGNATSRIFSSLSSAVAQYISGSANGTDATAAQKAYGSTAASTTFGISRANLIEFTGTGSALSGIAYGSITAAPIYLASNNVVRLTMSSAGLATWTTAYHILSVGTTANAPLRFITASAALNTTAVTGTLENDSTDLYWTSGIGTNLVRQRNATWGYRAITATYAVQANDRTLEATSGTFTATLPTAVGISGKVYILTNSGAGVVTVGTTSSQTFVNVLTTPTTLALSQFNTITVQSNGANWLRTTNL